MDLSIAAFLTQDGVTNGAIYALLALALVLVFTVTRVILIPPGEFVAYGTLTLARCSSASRPGTVGLLVGVAVVAARRRDVATRARRRMARGCRARLALWLGVPLLVAAAIVVGGAARAAAARCRSLLTLAIVTALGPLLYRIAYQPLADASVLVLLIVSVARALRADRPRTVVLRRRRLAHAARSPARRSSSAPMTFSGQSLLVVATSVVLIGALYLFFGRTLYGKALRATAVNRSARGWSASRRASPAR